MSGVPKGTKRKGGPRGAKADATRVSMLLRQRAVLALRVAGATFDTIARTLKQPNDDGKILASPGYDRSRAYKDFQGAVAELKDETREEVLKVELARLDTMHKKLWTKVQARGDRDAIDAVVQLMKLRAAYLGLFAPTKHEHGGTGGGAIRVDQTVTDVSKMSDEDLAARIKALRTKK